MTHLAHRLGISWPVLKASVQYLRGLRVRKMAQFFLVFERVDPFFVCFKWPGIYRSKEEAFLAVGKQMKLVYDLRHPV